jgi:mono/diheme cytochrome c family protein
VGQSLKPLHLICLLAILPACQNFSPAPPARPTSVSSGEALARRTCSGCHAVGHGESSSNPNAPPFSAIANQDGLTRETVTSWLEGAHNYPTEMDFYLGTAEVEELVAFLLALRDPRYQRPPD